MLSLFIKGVFLGFAIAAPIGPIGVLCIGRSLHNGFKIGLMTGLGAAFADGTYGLIAGFSLTAVSSLLIEQQFWIRLLGGLFLFYLGLKLFFMPLGQHSTRKYKNSAWHALSTTYLLTLTNPATLLAFIAIFAGFGLSQTSADYKNAVILVLGITFGSALWWMLLSSTVAFTLHQKLTPPVLRIINKMAGLIILCFSIYALSMK